VIALTRGRSRSAPRGRAGWSRRRPVATMTAGPGRVGRASRSAKGSTWWRAARCSVPGSRSAWPTSRTANRSSTTASGPCSWGATTPRPVIEGYLAQARDLGLTDAEDHRRPRGRPRCLRRRARHGHRRRGLLDEPLDVTGGRLLSTSTSEAGGVSYRASLYDTEGLDWLLIDSCYDGRSRIRRSCRLPASTWETCHPPLPARGRCAAARRWSGASGSRLPGRRAGRPGPRTGCDKRASHRTAPNRPPAQLMQERLDPLEWARSAGVSRPS
jgi:hypothetical protein